MMNIRHFFDNADEKTIDRITENYPLLNSKDKERLYAMSKKKYNRVQTENSPNSIEVSGVERYRRPVWHKILSAVAAAVVVLGGIGGGVLLLGKGGGVDPMTDIEATQPADEEATEATDVEETEAEFEQADYDYTAIAQQLFDDYLEGERIVCYGDVSYDENDSITFYTYTSNDAEWSANYGGERTFYKVTDERFNNGQDIYEMMKTITTTNNALRFDNNTSLIGRLVSDVSMFEIGSDVDLNDVDAERQVAAYGINLGVYIEYNGKLYVRPRPYEIEYTTEVKVIETSENGFTASRYMKMPHHNANIQYGEEVILEIVQENGEWKINYMESGIDVEYNASIAIQVYFEDDPDFYDLSIDPSDIIKNMEVLEYDDEIKRCKVHTIMIDVNGEEAVDFTGEIMLTKQTDEAIADAQVTRLNEYDGTLKRPSVLWAEQQGTLEN